MRIALRRRWRAVFVVALCFLALEACQRSATAPMSAPAHVTGTVWTPGAEVFFEHDPIVAGAGPAPWEIHITRRGDHSPVSEGRLTLRFRGPQNLQVTSEGPAEPGIFIPAPSLPLPGLYQVTLELDTAQDQERISLGDVQVYADFADIGSAPPIGAAIHYSKQEQWVRDFEVVRLDRRAVRRSIAVSGVIEPAASRVASVAAPVSGILPAEKNLGAPTPGMWVRKGALLATLAPLSSETSYASVKARMERLARESDRLARLFELEAIPERRLVEARRDLEVARAAFQAIEGSQEEGYVYAIRAPLGGVVEQRLFVPGEVVDVGAPLFSIVDPSVVWLHLRLPVREAHLAHQIEEVAFSAEGSEKIFHARGSATVANAIDAKTRTLPVTMGVDNPDWQLKTGLLVEGTAYIGGEAPGVAMPQAAIQHEDGVPVAYVQIGGESFERRPLVLGASDGAYSLVERGVAQGEYVVTAGAYQVYLASLTPTDIGDHDHPH